MQLGLTYTRHPLVLPVQLYADGQWQQFISAEISRAGIFVVMPAPKHKEGQVVQVKVALPESRELVAFAQIRKVVQSGLQSATGSGLGLEF